MATIPTENERQAKALERIEQASQLPEIIIYSHSSLFYWWPLWALGYLMAILTRLNGELITIGDAQEWFHPSRSLGAVYTVLFFLLIMITNVSVRGLASVVLILTVMFLTVLFAYLDWWETILSFLPHLSVHMNMGFYVFFSTLLFVVWAFAVFVYDRLHYWKVRPGQLTHEVVVGGAERSYDTRGMVFQKHFEDLFRHWILGFGAGDIQISTTGAKKEELFIPNVLFVNRKVAQMQKLIAVQPDQVVDIKP